MAFRLSLVVVLIAACTGTRWTRPSLRPHLVQQEAAVTVKVWCDNLDEGEFGELKAGSGVIVDSRHVITAEHVVRCDKSPVVRVVLTDGTANLMKVSRLDPGADLAILELLEAGEFKTKSVRPIVGKARVKDYVCSAVAFPKWRWNCGQINTIFAMPYSDVMFDAETVQGNSGSGLYNSRGQLIGIVTSKVKCPGGVVGGCFGLATSLYGRIPYYPK